MRFNVKEIELPFKRNKNNNILHSREKYNNIIYVITNNVLGVIYYIFDVLLRCAPNDYDIVCTAVVYEELPSERKRGVRRGKKKKIF